ncbi:MAG TPA: GNAT family N-acetyltransferase [Acidiferrobacter sp.]|nr:GNAT family N-acetyltransferase [Acidiferrobacter sp.]
MTEVSKAAWDALSGPQPFLRHEFLSALEESGSVGPHTGWQTETLVAYEGSVLTVAVPLYRKSHSYGEYVFDWAWAHAYREVGLEYYPKLVAAVPFTPVTGPRLLTEAAARTPELAHTVAEILQTHARATGASSVHWLFLPDSECVLLEPLGFMRRTGFQFHWTNSGWSTFAEFLAALARPKRKNIARERRQVADAGITYRVYEGAALTESLWDTFYHLYLTTIQKYQAIPYLTRAFFSLIGQNIPGVVLLFAYQGTQSIAAALYFRDADTLYGRYWGTIAQIPGLHFETCYYQAIDYCLAHGLKRFEAGAQGEHKLSRGFLPTPTYSLHWLDQPQFNRAVEDFLVRENQGIDYVLNELDEHSPFQKPS